MVRQTLFTGSAKGSKRVPFLNCHKDWLGGSWCRWEWFRVTFFWVWLLCKGILWISGYGMTETAPSLIVTPVGWSKEGSSGVVLPNTKVRVVDVETGKNLGPGQRGEICAQGPQVKCWHEGLGQLFWHFFVGNEGVPQQWRGYQDYDSRRLDSHWRPRVFRWAGIFLHCRQAQGAHQS